MAAITWPVPSAPSEELSDSILFTRKWDLSDVALKAKDSDTLLYANKNVLAVHSDYFKTLFFSDFAESKQDVVVVNLSYWAVLTILRVIHHVDRRFGADTRALMPVDKLVELYKAGDYCDIALIREYCKYEISRHSPSISVEAYIKLDMTKEKTAELKRMKYDEIQLCLKRGIPGLIFSAEDVRIIVDKCLEAEVKRIRCWKCGKSELVGNKEGDVTTGHCMNCDSHFIFNSSGKFK